MDDEDAWSFWQRVMLQHAHPAKLAVDSAGAVACCLLMWFRRPGPALAVLFGASATGSLLARSADVDDLAETRLGQWMLPQAEPANLVIRTAGFALLLKGLYDHRWVLSLVGAALIIGGRPIGNLVADFPGGHREGPLSGR